MKRFIVSLLTGAACVAHLAASDEPPAEDWPGWLSPAPAEWAVAEESGGGAQSLGVQAPASLPPLAEALDSVPSSIPAAQAFSLGLSTNVARGTDDLVMETARGLGCREQVGMASVGGGVGKIQR